MSDLLTYHTEKLQKAYEDYTVEFNKFLADINKEEYSSYSSYRDAIVREQNGYLNEINLYIEQLTLDMDNIEIQNFRTSLLANLTEKYSEFRKLKDAYIRNE